MLSVVGNQCVSTICHIGSFSRQTFSNSSQKLHKLVRFRDSPSRLSENNHNGNITNTNLGRGVEIGLRKLKSCRDWIHDKALEGWRIRFNTRNAYTVIGRILDALD